MLDNEDDGIVSLSGNKKSGNEGEGEDCEEEDEEEEYEGDDNGNPGDAAVLFLTRQNKAAAQAVEKASARLADTESYSKEDKPKLVSHLQCAKKALLDTHRSLKKLGVDSIAPEISKEKKSSSDETSKYLYMCHPILPKEAENKPILIAEGIKHFLRRKLVEQGGNDSAVQDVGIHAEIDVCDKVYIFIVLVTSIGVLSYFCSLLRCIKSTCRKYSIS